MTGNVVTVFVQRLGSSRAECTCGWQSRRRIFRAAAHINALQHSADGCQLNYPLICKDPIPL